MKHFIILSSSYSKGKRIGLHYNDKMVKEIECIQEDIEKIQDEFGISVSISTHYITTDDNTFESVIQKDAFFKGVEIIDTLEEFIELIRIDRELTGIDVAKYILSRCDCTHLKLEKLVYFCYADYIVKTKKKLFNDEICTFKLGPVIKSVYDKYKGLKDIEEIKTGVSPMPFKSRILFAEDGIRKLDSIDKTLDRYLKYSSTELVNLTHKKDSPWDISNKLNSAKILDEVIIKYHKVL